MSAEKWCNCCEEYKPVAEFSANRTASDGYQTYCKACNQAYKRTGKFPFISPR